MFYLDEFENEERVVVRRWLVNVDEMVARLPGPMGERMLSILRGPTPFAIRRMGSLVTSEGPGIELDPQTDGPASLLHALVILAGGSTFDARILENLAYGRAQRARAPSEEELMLFEMEGFRGEFVFRNYGDDWIYSLAGRVRLMPWTQIHTGRRAA